MVGNINVLIEYIKENYPDEDCTNVEVRNKHRNDVEFMEFCEENGIDWEIFDELRQPEEKALKVTPDNFITVNDVEAVQPYTRLQRIIDETSESIIRNNERQLEQLREYMTVGYLTPNEYGIGYTEYGTTTDGATVRIQFGD